MSASTNIEWCDSTFNPWMGCTKVSPACDHCYAERDTRRFGRVEWGAGKPRLRTSVSNWKLPERWNKEPFVECMSCGWRGEKRECNSAQNPSGFQPPVASMLACPRCKEPTMKVARRRVFCASLADWLDNEVPIEWLVDLLDLIRRTPNLDWLMLSKRVGNWRRRLEDAALEAKERGMPSAIRDPTWQWIARWLNGYEVPPNVWIGATVVNQAEVDRDIQKLLTVPARVRFLSIEPMLGPVSLDCWPIYGPDRAPLLHWIIVGGESGPHARPIHPDWARSLRDQCVAAGVPFHFKQWGEHLPEFDRDRDDPDWRVCDAWARKPGRWINLAGGHGFHGERVHYAHRIGKKAAGRTLDGRTWDEFPEGT